MPDLPGIGGAALTSSLNDLKSTVERLAASFADAMSTVAESVTESSSIIEKKITTAASAIIGATTNESLEEIRNSEEEGGKSSQKAAGFFGALTDSIAETAGAIVKAL